MENTSNLSQEIYFCKLIEVKKTRFPDCNTKREPCRPALLDIGESLSAYLQADFNIIPSFLDVNTFMKNSQFFYDFFHQNKIFK